MKTVVRCNKTLIHGDGSESFTKGQIYMGQSANVLESLKVKDNQGCDHTLGIWAKYFTKIVI